MQEWFGKVPKKSEEQLPEAAVQQAGEMHSWNAFGSRSFRCLPQRFLYVQALLRLQVEDCTHWGTDPQAALTHDFMPS